jgi:large exoprotein involved in heme utilization and adhesion
VLWSLGNSASEAGGAIQLDPWTTGSVTLTTGGQVLSQARSGGPGGALTLTAGSLVVDGRAQILSDAQNTGPGGAIDVDVEGLLEVTNLGKIVALASAGAGAPGGNVEVTADEIRVTSVDTPLSDASQISALTEGDAPGGSLTLQAASIHLQDGGQVRTTTDGGEGDAGLLRVEGRAGGRLASLRIAGSVDAGGETIQAGIFARALGDGTPGTDDGNGGQIRIDAEEVEVGLGGVISSRTFEDGSAGNLDIENADLVKIEGGEVSAKGAAGAGGDLTIVTDVLEVTAGGNASASALGVGDAGKVEVTARKVLVSGTDAGGGNRSGLFAQTLFADLDSGDSGSVVLTVTESVVVDDDGRISVESKGGGFAGDIEIAGPAGGELALLQVKNGAEISALVRDTRAPTSPDDNVTADILIERVARVEVDAATITAETRGTGEGGTITFRDVGEIAMTGATLTAATTDAISLDAGAGGNIVFVKVTDWLDLVDTTITAETQGAGDGGSIGIGVDEAGAAQPVGAFSMTGGKISTETSGAGAGGDIGIVTARSVTLLDGARVTARSSSDADAGNIGILAGGSFVAVASSPLPGVGGIVTTEATGSEASGGQILIGAADMVYLSDARIETNVSKGLSAGDDSPPAQGDGGNVFMLSPGLVVLNRSRIVASAEQGSGGNITISGTFLPSDRLIEDEDFATRSDSVLDATSETDPGEVVITSPDSDLAGQLTPLPIAYFDASKMMMTPCAARRARAGSFVVQSQAVEPPPDAPLTASAARDAVPDTTLYEWERESCPN